MKTEKIDETRLTPTDEAKINRLLERAFQEDFGGRSYHQQRHNLRLIAREGDIITGHMALCYRSIRMGDALVKIMGLGDVATDPDYQGQGIASALMTEAIAEARASAADFFLLFGVRPIYAGRGFRAAPNAIKHVAMYHAHTDDVRVQDDPYLMVMELKGITWDDTAVVDLLGFSF